MWTQTYLVVNIFFSSISMPMFTFEEFNLYILQWSFAPLTIISLRNIWLFLRVKYHLFQMQRNVSRSWQSHKPYFAPLWCEHRLRAPCCLRCIWWLMVMMMCSRICLTKTTRASRRQLPRFFALFLTKRLVVRWWWWWWWCYI